MKNILLSATIVLIGFAFAQAQPVISKNGILRDTTLNPLEFFDYSKTNTQEFMPQMKEGIIYAGKASHNVMLKNMQVDATSNAARQWFSKVPGVTVWESDGSGLNTSVATRGWSPNRSWDLNVRMDGMDIASDPIGYPEAYYTPPTEFIQNIELIKGAGALAFGTQFGGAINYQTVNPSVKKINYTGLYSAGDYGTESHFHGISGTQGKNAFGAWFQERQSNGWRENSEYKTRNYLVKWNRTINTHFKFLSEYNRHHSVSQQPGGLTDQGFEQSIFSSNRSRNWFELDWQVLGLTTIYQKNNFLWKNQLSAMRGERNSIGITGKINLDDVYDDSLGYAQRKLDKDLYQNLSFESRYQFKTQQNIELAGGMRLFKGDTDRLQNGKGTRGIDADFELDENQIFDRDLNYYSKNLAIYQEAIFHLGRKLNIIPGIRYEWIENTVNGKYSNAYEILEQSKNRNVLLFGASANYQVDSNNEIVFNYNRSYRPALFSELTPTATTDIIDPNIKDAKGYNMDIMMRGKVFEHLNYHIGGYYTFYGDRLGSYKKDNVLYNTNIGDAVSKGSEVRCYDSRTHPSKLWSYNLWASMSWMDVRYTKWNDKTILDEEKMIENKRVENAPRYIHRAGANFSYKKFSCQGIWNSVGSIYTDAVNTVDPSEDATVGMLEGYTVIDASVKYNLSSHVYLQINVNNITNAKYATRRTGGLPGPGLLPGSPRIVTATLGINL